MSETNGNGHQISFPARLLPALYSAVQSTFSLQPPMTPRGKYLLAKIATGIAAELPHYQQQKFELLQKHAAKDEENAPILRVTDKGNGQSEVACDPVDKAAFNAEDANLGSTPVTLPGLSLLTHRDIGDCPIPQGPYSIMLGVLIEDPGHPPE